MSESPRSSISILTVSFALLALIAGCGQAPLPDGPAPAPPGPREDVVEAEPDRPEDRAIRVVRVGVVLPQTGDTMLTRYAELVLQGVQLAARTGSAGGRRVELVVRDDGGVPARAARMVAELEREGVVGVVGPLLPSAMADAAQARRDRRLALVSPTATSMPGGLQNVYSVNAQDGHGIRALAEYAVRTGLREVALLFPFMPPYQQQAASFMDAVRASGGRVAAEIGYAPGTTTFAGEMQQLQRSGAQAVFIPAPPRDVRQIAPQLRYYGVRATGMQVLGGDTWVRDDVLRRVEEAHLEDVIAVTQLLRTSHEVGWQEFVDLYEQTYRRLLDSEYPALGYDAALLILAGDSGSAGRGDLSAVLTRLREVRGATGVFTFQDGALMRRPFIVRIQGGALHPVARTGSVGASEQGR